ncbi:MAG: phage integrase SAM-like domain-containing protein [Bacteroidia bacterium]
MANIRIILKLNKLNKMGEAPLYLRIIKDRKSIYKSIGVYLKPIDWNIDTGRIKKSHPNSQRINNLLMQKLAEAENTVLESESKNRHIKASKIKEILTGKSPESFINYANKITNELKESEKVRTYKRYKTVIKKLSDYLKGKDFMMDELTVSFLYDYELHLKKLGNDVNTIHSNLKTLRALLYRAIREDLLSQDKNPFFKFKLKNAPTKKEKLTSEEIQKLIDLKVEEKIALWHCKNYFLFSYYNAGIRAGDLIQLKWENIRNNRLVYTMDKTGTLKNIGLLPQALEILSYYKREDLKGFIFPLLNNNSDYSNKHFLYSQVSAKNALINKNLKKIASLAEIDKPLSFHIARHSFSDFARRNKMNVYDISQALGHSSLKITEIYLAAFDDNSLDAEMSRIFSKDYVTL